MSDNGRDRHLLKLKIFISIIHESLYEMHYFSDKCKRSFRCYKLHLIIQWHDGKITGE